MDTGYRTRWSPRMKRRHAHDSGTIVACLFRQVEFSLTVVDAMNTFKATVDGQPDLLHLVAENRRLNIIIRQLVAIVDTLAAMADESIMAERVMADLRIG